MRVAIAGAGALGVLAVQPLDHREGGLDQPLSPKGGREFDFGLDLGSSLGHPYSSQEMSGNRANLVPNTIVSRWEREPVFLRAKQELREAGVPQTISFHQPTLTLGC